MKRLISVTINGKQRTDEVEPRLLLIHYLREVVGLTVLNFSSRFDSAGNPPNLPIVIELHKLAI